MKVNDTDLFPEEPPRNLRREIIKIWWTDLEMCGDAGGTTWEVLDVLRDRVTECLDRDEVAEAESLTALAQLLIEGIDEC